LKRGAFGDDSPGARTLFRGLQQFPRPRRTRARTLFFNRISGASTSSLAAPAPAHAVRLYSIEPERARASRRAVNRVIVVWPAERLLRIGGPGGTDLRSQHMFSLAGTIDHFAPHLRPPLVAVAASAAVRHVAGQLPAGITNWVDIECRLAADRPQVDLIVKVDRRGRAMLAAQPWPRLRALARAWGDSATTLHRAVGAVWLEYDIDRVAAVPGEDRRTLRPRVFLDLAPGAYAASSTACRLTAIADALAPLAGEPTPGWLRRGLERCLRHLPPHAYLLYVGLPAEDRIERVRLCVLGLGEDRIAGYLSAVGWPGDLTDLREHLARLAGVPGGEAVRIATLHFDLDDRERVKPALGFEYPLARRPQVRGAIREQPLFECLVACGACDAGKRDALLRWPGCAIETLPHAIWPSLVMRRVSHVKVVYQSAGALEAKAYLCGSHEFRRAPQPPVAAGL
jgi:hypothetical protein